MKKLNTGIFIFDGVEVLDFAGPFEVFSRTRLVPRGRIATLRCVGAIQRVHGGAIGRSGACDGGLRILPHFDFAGAPPIELLVIPGGFDTRQSLDDLDVREWIQNAANEAR
jgi:putative intracellular protease/amidase